VLDAAFKVAQTLFRELDASNPAWKKIRADYRAFQKEQLNSARFTDAPFNAFMQQQKL